MINQNECTGSEKLDRYLAGLGFAYDAGQEIFYSTMDAWQRKYGYCRLYDEAAPLLSMIMDSEPVTFQYGGKRWLIQFWKGQYAMATGGEIGVYNTGRPDINISGVYKGPFYRTAGPEEILQLSFILNKNGKALFYRGEKHWWLSGFSLGQFSEPENLTMNLSVTVKDRAMLQAFIDGLKRAGYSDREISIYGLKVALLFAKPRTPQPATRNRSTDWIIQRKNELLCKKYQKITGSFETIPEKFKALKKKAPGLYHEAMNIRSTGRLLERYGILPRGKGSPQ